MIPVVVETDHDLFEADAQSVRLASGIRRT